MPEGELWRPVSGFGPVAYELYEVSDHGRVRSKGRWIDYTHANGNPVRYWKDGRILRLAPTGRNHDYRCIQLCLGGGVKIPAHVHVLVLEAFVGPRPTGYVACHGDGDGCNNTPANLRWDTYSANNYDRVAHGRHPKTQRTHCPRNHPLADPNLAPNYDSSSHRRCLACARACAAQRDRRRRGLPQFDLQERADINYDRILKTAAEQALTEKVAS